MNSWMCAAAAVVAILAPGQAAAAIMDATFKGTFANVFFDPEGIFNDGSPGQYASYEAFFRYDTADLRYGLEYVDVYGVVQKHEYLDTSDGSPFLAGWIIMNGVRYDFTPTPSDYGHNDTGTAFFRIGAPGSAMAFFGGDHLYSNGPLDDPTFRSLATPGWTKGSSAYCADGCEYVNLGGDTYGYPNEFTLSVSFAAVPEPSTWALMIAGFGTAGAALRRRPRVA